MPQTMTDIEKALRDMDYGPAQEDATTARDWLTRHAEGFGHFIAGRFTPPEALFEVTAPATGETLARVSQGSAATVEAAVRAARTAQPGWAALPGTDRATHLYALSRHIQKRARFLAVLETLDTGKPIRESRDIDIPLAARHFLHHAGWAALVAEDFPGQQPWGVCGQVIPWNFPLLTLSWKLAPALAAGNTVVLKPAEWTPLTALAFAEIAQEAGLPPGVVNIVTGDGQTGAALVAHPGVDKIAFTGSTDTGRAIRRAKAGSGKGLTLELGGKSPFLVFDDADLDAAVDGVVDGIWFNQGEVCCAGSRILVQESVAEQFGAKLRARMARLRVGDPLDKNADIGAIIHPRQTARIRALVAQGQAEGAELWTGTAPDGGAFLPPMVLAGAAPASVVAQEEIFGPVAVLMSFRTPDEAVALANATRYGLAASIWSEGIARALDVAARLAAGVVWINATNLFDANAPFGGMRESGFGREGGRAGMAAYLRPPPVAAAPAPRPVATAETPPIDRTPKLYIGGRQTRPDGGNSASIRAANGALLGQAPLAGRKDVRNAVEAAHAARGWAGMGGAARAQVLFYMAEVMAAQRPAIAARLSRHGLDPAEAGAAEARVIWHAARADKLDGRVQDTAQRMATLALNVPFGVAGVVCPTDSPYLGFLSCVLPLIAAGNRVVAVASGTDPLPALALAEVFDTCDLPGGVVNILSGPSGALGRVLAGHDDVALLWHFGSADEIAEAECESAGNLKPVWAPDRGVLRDWAGRDGHGSGFLDAAQQIRTIWIPYGA